MCKHVGMFYKCKGIDYCFERYVLDVDLFWLFYTNRAKHYRQHSKKENDWCLGISNVIKYEGYDYNDAVTSVYCSLCTLQVNISHLFYCNEE